MYLRTYVLDQAHIPILVMIFQFVQYTSFVNLYIIKRCIIPYHPAVLFLPFPGSDSSGVTPMKVLLLPLYYTLLSYSIFIIYTYVSMFILYVVYIFSFVPEFSNKIQ